MTSEILGFAAERRICVAAFEMQDGAPHGATLHYAQTDEPFRLYFLTDGETRKAGALANKDQVRATVVIGFDESDMRTLQMDGIARRVPADDAFREAYLGKFPEKGKYLDDDACTFVFEPDWWRFTDWTKGNRIISSED